MPTTTGSPFTLMQMNLCLSGHAGCHDASTYRAAVQEVVDRIRVVDPDAVTLNEVCQGDAERMARLTGYQLRFARVIYLGELLDCVDPSGRGLFGDAVLTRAPIVASESRAFETQSGPEERRWLCVTTRHDLDVCTSHLNTRHTPTSAATNDGQCAELAELLARRGAARTVVFGGDVNKLGSCAPNGFWTRSDRGAEQAPGVQHVYGGSRDLHRPSVEVQPASYSDHDVLVVRARQPLREVEASNG